MSRRKSCIWTVLVVYVLGTGCALGPLASYRPVSPIARPVGYEGLDRIPAAGGVETSTLAALRSLTGSEIETLWGELSTENPELADQSAGEEIVVRHVYGEPDYGDMTWQGALVLLGILVAVFALAG